MIGVDDTNQQFCGTARERVRRITADRSTVVIPNSPYHNIALLQSRLTRALVIRSHFAFVCQLCVGAGNRKARRQGGQKGGEYACYDVVPRFVTGNKTLR